MKFECPTFLRSKGKSMAITFSDGEVSDHKFGSDEDGNFFVVRTYVVHVLRTYVMILCNWLIS